MIFSRADTKYLIYLSDCLSGMTFVSSCHCEQLYSISRPSAVHLSSPWSWTDMVYTGWPTEKGSKSQWLKSVFIVQPLSPVRLLATPWTAAHQASLVLHYLLVCSNSCSLSQWCHPAILSTVIHFSSCLNPSQHQGLFQRVNSSHEVAKVLEFQPQHQSFQWIFRTDFL